VSDESTYDAAIFQWRDGERRLAGAPVADVPALEMVRDRILEELRRRLGGSFTVGELVDLYYDEGTDWCLDLAVQAAPEHPAAWDSAIVADAAFARYLREATDFAGGRRIETG
jgi:hypothetical protein